MRSQASPCETSDTCSYATCKTIQTLAHGLVLRFLFIQQVKQKANDPSRDNELSLDRVPRKWEPLDTELPTAILQVVAGPLGREMLGKQECMHAMGETLAGRAALWSLHHRFKSDRGVPSQVEMSKLMSLKLEGCHQFFFDRLYAVWVMFRNVPDDVFLLALVDLPAAEGEIVRARVRVPRSGWS